MKKVVICLLSLMLFSCTSNEMAKQFGGTQTIELKPNEKLLNITWKDNDMWALTIDTTTNIQYFREFSNYGIWEGEVIVNSPSPQKDEMIINQNVIIK